MKARRNRIRLQKRRPRIRFDRTATPTVSLAYYENETRPAIAGDKISAGP